MAAPPARSLVAAASCLVLLAQATGAADLIPAFQAARFPAPPAPVPAAVAPPQPVEPAPPPPVALSAPPPALARVPDTPPVADRIMVRKAPGFVRAAPTSPPDVNELVRRLRREAAAFRPVFADTLEQPWVEGRGLRLRVIFLKPVGVTWGDARGFHGQVLPRPVIDLPAPVPPAYRRSFPLYFAGDRVDYEIELENTGPLPLPPLTLRARQERFDPSGGIGEPLGRVDLQDVPALPWGGRVVLRGSFALSPGGRQRLNFEQTHLTVVDAGAADAAPRLDAPQAGIADPPAP